jgi:hypothetical protein
MIFDNFGPTRREEARQRITPRSIMLTLKHDAELAVLTPTVIIPDVSSYNHAHAEARCGTGHPHTHRHHSGRKFF